MLVQGKTRLRLVVLNSCLGTEGDDARPFSSVAAGMVRSGIPAVIAMQFEISDDAARAIAETFYTSLTLNMPVDAALTEARREIFLSDRNSLEWATPILYMQVPDGQLFQFTPGITGEEDTGPQTVRGKIPAIAMLVRSDNGKETMLSLESIKIGRGANNDINVPDLSVSRKHAILTLAGSTYTIKDVPGSSGTQVNGVQVTQRALKNNDVVRLGSVEFRFLSLVAEDSQTGPPTHRSESTANVSVQIDAEDSLDTKAAKRYQDGEDAMARRYNVTGRFSQPDPYSGSYDFSDPQSTED